MAGFEVTLYGRFWVISEDFSRIDGVEGAVRGRFGMEGIIMNPATVWFSLRLAYAKMRMQVECSRCLVVARSFRDCEHLSG